MMSTAVTDDAHTLTGCDKHRKDQLKKRRTARNMPQESENLVAADAVGVAMLVCLAEISAIDFAVAKT